MAAITSQLWRRLVNAYEVKAGMVCLQCKNCVSVSEVNFSRWGAIQIYLPLRSLCVTPQDRIKYNNLLRSVELLSHWCWDEDDVWWLQTFDVVVETSLSGSYIDGRITCRFHRLKQPLRNDSQLYPLNSYTEYFVLLARGPSMAGNGSDDQGWQNIVVHSK